MTKSDTRYSYIFCYQTWRNSDEEAIQPILEPWKVGESQQRGRDAHLCNLWKPRPYFDIEFINDTNSFFLRTGASLEIPRHKWPGFHKWPRWASRILCYDSPIFLGSKMGSIASSLLFLQVLYKKCKST